MRWGDDGDEGADGGDDVDDDSDDARRDGDDDGDDFPLREGISLEDFSLPEPFFFLSSFRLAGVAEYLFKVCPGVFMSKANNTSKGSRRWSTKAKGGPQPRPEVGPQPGVALPLVARLRSPSWLRDLFLKK